MTGTFKILFFLTLINSFNNTSLFSQTILANSNKINKVDTVITRLVVKEQIYKLNNEQLFVYKKPKPFGFITNLPKDAAGIVKTTFKRKSIVPLLIVAGATLALLPADEAVSVGVQKFSTNIHFHSEEDYRDIFNIKAGKTNISILKAPQNINTALYQMGQGFPSLLIGAGLFTYGKIHNDYRALSTASQLTETFILMGVGTQFLKRISGRQSPSNATDEGGNWHLFPSFKKFQTNTPNYDAFPSGHLATLMSTVTILAQNYPEKGYIKPVGYSLIGLVGLSMINNNVHWISDYPMAIALGYLCARQVVKRNRKIINTASSQKNKATLSYTFNYANGRLMPGVIYKF